MSLKRRDFLRLSAGGTTFGSFFLSELPVGLGPLDLQRSMTDGVVPITVEERQSRIAKAQRLMADNKIAAVILDSGTSQALPLINRSHPDPNQIIITT